MSITTAIKGWFDFDLHNVNHNLQQFPRNLLHSREVKSCSPKVVKPSFTFRTTFSKLIFKFLYYRFDWPKLQSDEQSVSLIEKRLRYCNCEAFPSASVLEFVTARHICAVCSDFQQKSKATKVRFTIATQQRITENPPSWQGPQWFETEIDHGQREWPDWQEFRKSLFMLQARQDWRWQEKMTKLENAVWPKTHSFTRHARFLKDSWPPCSSGLDSLASMHGLGIWS